MTRRGVSTALPLSMQDLAMMVLMIWWRQVPVGTPPLHTWSSDKICQKRVASSLCDCKTACSRSV